MYVFHIRMEQESLEFIDEWIDECNKRLSSDEPWVNCESVGRKITCLTSGQLERDLNRILSLSLRLLNHHYAPNQITGLTALSHITDNVCNQRLKETGSSGLIVHSLQHSLVREEMVEKVIPVIIRVMRKLGTDPSSDVCDDIMFKILNDLDLATTVTKKQIYWSSLDQLMQFIGLPVIRFSKRIVNRMSDHLSYPLTSDSVDMFHCLLQATASFVHVTRSSCQRFSPQILFSLFSFCYTNHTCIGEFDTITRDVNDLLDIIQKYNPDSYNHTVDVVSQNDPQNRLTHVLKERKVTENCDQ